MKTRDPSPFIHLADATAIALANIRAAATARLILNVHPAMTAVDPAIERRAELPALDELFAAFAAHPLPPLPPLPAGPQDRGIEREQRDEDERGFKRHRTLLRVAV